MGGGNKSPGFELPKTSYLQYEVAAVYTTIPSTFCTGIYLHLFIANKTDVKYSNTWVH
jgi:hypothetical protein